MNQSFNIPKFKVVRYAFNPETGHYQKTAQQPELYPVNVLPYELRREQTQAAQIKCNAAEILTIRERKKSNGSRKLLTGLQPLSVIALGWYYGNIAQFRNGEKKLSDLLIRFSEDGSMMHVFLFSGYHKDGKTERERFAAAIIPHLLKRL